MIENKFRFWTPDNRMLDDHQGWVEDIGINYALELSKEYGYIPMQFIGVKDKNKRDVYVGDIVIGYVGWMRGDGYLKKGYPDKIRILLEVIVSDGKGYAAGFHLKSIKVHPDDAFAAKKYFYRSIQYNLEESREFQLKDNEIVWKGFNETIEVVGNIYQNKELLVKSKVKTTFW